MAAQLNKLMMMGYGALPYPSLMMAETKKEEETFKFP